MKIVGKSIRDRVALIKWRRERTVSPGSGETQQNLLQLPSTGLPQGTTLADTDYEDQEVEPQTLTCTVPTTTSTTCKSLSRSTHGMKLLDNMLPHPLVINLTTAAHSAFS